MIKKHNSIVYKTVENVGNADRILKLLNYFLYYGAGIRKD